MNEVKRDLSSRCVDLDECVRESDDDTTKSSTGSTIGFTGRCGKGKVCRVVMHSSLCFPRACPLSVCIDGTSDKALNV